MERDYEQARPEYGVVSLLTGSDPARIARQSIAFYKEGLNEDPKNDAYKAALRYWKITEKMAAIGLEYAMPLIERASNPNVRWAEELAKSLVIKVIGKEVPSKEISGLAAFLNNYNRNKPTNGSTPSPMFCREKGRKRHKGGKSGPGI